MGTTLFILAGLLVVIVLLGIIGILSRYRKCKSDEVLVVYGKTGGSKSAKLYHGGAAFVWPIIQGYDFLSMKPMQIDRRTSVSTCQRPSPWQSAPTPK